VEQEIASEAGARRGTRVRETWMPPFFGKGAKLMPSWLILQSDFSGLRFFSVTLHHCDAVVESKQ